jgi:hypothetical protein
MLGWRWWAATAPFEFECIWYLAMPSPANKQLLLTYAHRPIGKVRSGFTFLCVATSRRFVRGISSLLKTTSDAPHTVRVRVRVRVRESAAWRPVDAAHDSQQPALRQGGHQQTSRKTCLCAWWVQSSARCGFERQSSAWRFAELGAFYSASPPFSALSGCFAAPRPLPPPWCAGTKPCERARQQAEKKPKVFTRTSRRTMTEKAARRLRTYS